MANPGQSSLLMERPVPSLLDLPAELIPLIAQHLTKVSHINALCLTHSSLHRLLDAALYRHSVEHDDSFVLIYASLTGNIATLKKALDLAADANINTCIKCRDIRFIAASRSYHPEGIDLACCGTGRGSRYATIPGASELAWQESTPLSCAVVHEHVEVVQFLVSRGGARIASSFSEQQSRSETRAPSPALHIAVHLNNFTIVETLLLGLRAARDRGQEDPVEIRRIFTLPLSGLRSSSMASCPLYLALRNGHAGVVEMLLHAMKEHIGAEATAEVVREMMPAGDVRVFRGRGVHDELIWSLLKAEPTVFERLVCLMDDFGGGDSLGETADFASKTGDLTKLRILVERGLVPEIPGTRRVIPYGLDEAGESDTASEQQGPHGRARLVPLLHFAVAAGHVETVRYLLEVGADPTARMVSVDASIRVNDEYTALHVAMSGPEASLAAIVCLLVEHQEQQQYRNHSHRPQESSSGDGLPIDCRALSPMGLTPLMLLFVETQHIQHSFYSWHPRQSKSRSSHRDKASTSSDIDTPYCTAVFRTLVSHGADVTAESLPDSRGPPRSVLDLAAARDCYSCTRAMLQILGYERTITAMQTQWDPPNKYTHRNQRPGECVRRLDGMIVAVLPPAKGGEHVARWRNQLGPAFWDQFGEREEEVEMRRCAIEEFRESWDDGRRVRDFVEDKNNRNVSEGRARRRRRRQERVEARSRHKT